MRFIPRFFFSFVLVLVFSLPHEFLVSFWLIRRTTTVYNIRLFALLFVYILKPHTRKENEPKIHYEALSRLKVFWSLWM